MTRRTLEEVAARLGGRLTRTAEGAAVDGVSSLADAGPRDLAFLLNRRHVAHAARCRAAAIVTSAELSAELGASGSAMPIVVVVADPERALEEAVALFRPVHAAIAGIHADATVAPSARLAAGVAVEARAVIGDGAELGEGTRIGAGAIIGPRVRIGRDCVVHANAVVRDGSILGDRVVVHPGAVLGADGFGFRPGPQGLVKLEHAGIVEIGDDVEIGANATIDRARVGRTVVGRGTKIDNLVQVGHNCRIGEHVILVAQVGLSGSTEVGAGAVFGGQAATAGHLRVGRGAKVAARGGVSKDVPDGAVVYGYVAGPHRERQREEAAVRKLPRLLERIRELEQRLARIEARSDGAEPE